MLIKHLMQQVELFWLTVGGADFRVEPAINIRILESYREWSINFDPSNATSYTVTSLEPNRTKFSAKMWGQDLVHLKVDIVMVRFL